MAQARVAPSPSSTCAGRPITTQWQRVQFQFCSQSRRVDKVMSEPSRPKLSESDVGLIRQAMALRVKYRVAGPGTQLRRIIPKLLGVHPANRGGVYPQPDRVKNLMLDILDWGFSIEEADHAGICVQTGCMWKCCMWGVARAGKLPADSCARQVARKKVA